jgi:hypothetical protein
VDKWTILRVVWSMVKTKDYLCIVRIRRNKDKVIKVKVIK